jgi:hypothetical protein
MKPTIVSQIRTKTANSDESILEDNKAHSVRQIIRPEASEEMRNALFNVATINDQYKNARVE